MHWFRLFRCQMKVLWCLQWFATARVQQSWEKSLAEPVYLWGFLNPWSVVCLKHPKAPCWATALFPLHQDNIQNKDDAYVPSGCGSYLFWCIKLLSWPLLSAAGKWSTGFQAVMWWSLSISRVAHTVIKHITAAKLIIPSLSLCTINRPRFLTSLRCGVYVVVISYHLAFLVYLGNRFGLVFYIHCLLDAQHTTVEQGRGGRWYF